ncbi:MAG TPA: hypothetical protein VM240_07115, partial [Verrucomicrobiae bacterium]|nr:hypothetical protein [Verrucomicrobiae bacterium]
MSPSLVSRASFLVRSAAVLSMLAGSFGALAQTGPTPFTYIERTGVATGVLVTSEAKTITGFDGTLAVSVTGEGSPQYKVGTAAFTSTPGSITAGQTLTIRHTSSSQASTAHTSVVTVGSYSTNFRSVTGTTDRTPNPFDFGITSNVAPSSFVDSPVLTLTGF